ncbi:hypothetical protein ACH4K8_16685 [Streptomyces anulatus]
MEPLATTVIVNLTDHPESDPRTSWILSLDALDMTVEDTMGMLESLTWLGGGEYPAMSSLRSRTGVYNWGASSSSSQFVLDLAASGLAGMGVVAIDAGVRAVFRKLRDRARGDDWGGVISEEDALTVAKSRIASQYGVEQDDLAVRRAQTDAVDHSHEFEFDHSDGRSFGAVVGIFKDSPSCTRIWREAPTDTSGAQRQA